MIPNYFILAPQSIAQVIDMNTKKITRNIFSFVFSLVGIAIAIALIKSSDHDNTKSIRLRATREKKIEGLEASYLEENHLVKKNNIPETVRPILDRALLLSSDKPNTSGKIEEKSTVENQTKLKGEIPNGGGKSKPESINTLREAKNRIRDQSLLNGEPLQRALYPLKLPSYYEISLNPFFIKLMSPELCLSAKNSAIATNIYECISM